MSQSRPLEAFYPLAFFDAMCVKVRDWPRPWPFALTLTRELSGADYAG